MIHETTRLIHTKLSDKTNNREIYLTKNLKQLKKHINFFFTKMFDEA